MQEVDDKLQRTCRRRGLRPRSATSETVLQAVEVKAIRPAVVNRKVWGGNRSDRGAETQGRMMTFLRTAHQQGADAVAMLVDLARAPNPGVVAGLTLRPG